MSHEHAVARITASLACGSSNHEVEFTLTNWGYVDVFVARAHIPPVLLKVGGKRPCAGLCSFSITAIRSALTQLFLVLTTHTPRSSRRLMLPNSLVGLQLPVPSKLELCGKARAGRSELHGMRAKPERAKGPESWHEVELALDWRLQRLADSPADVAASLLGLGQRSRAGEAIREALNDADERRWSAAALLASLGCTPSIAAELARTFDARSDPCSHAFAIWTMTEWPWPEFQPIIRRVVAGQAGLGCSEDAEAGRVRGKRRSARRQKKRPRAGREKQEETGETPPRASVAAFWLEPVMARLYRSLAHAPCPEALRALTARFELMGRFDRWNDWQAVKAALLHCWRAVVRRLGPQAATVLRQVLRECDGELRTLAARGLGEVGAREHLQDLARYVRDNSLAVRTAVLRAWATLATRLGPDAMPEVLSVIQADLPELHPVALKYIENDPQLALRLEPEVPRLIRPMMAGGPAGRRSAARDAWLALIERIGYVSRSALTSLAGSDDSEMRVLAARTLARVGTVDHLDIIAKLENDYDYCVRMSAQAARRSILKRTSNAASEVTQQ